MTGSRISDINMCQSKKEWRTGLSAGTLYKTAISLFPADFV
jgi:hypothetical protein